MSASENSAFPPLPLVINSRLSQDEPGAHGFDPGTIMELSQDSSPAVDNMELTQETAPSGSNIIPEQLTNFEKQLYDAILSNQLPVFMYQEMQAVHPIVFQLLEQGKHISLNERNVAPTQSNKRSRLDEDGFQFPPLRHTARTPIHIGSTSETNPLQNKFSALNETKLNDPSIDNSDKMPKPIKIRHITIAKTANFKEILDAMAGPNDEVKFQASPAGEFIRVLPKTIEDHTKIANFMKEKAVSGFILPMGVVHPVKIVIKGLTKDFSTQEIQNELTKLGFPVQKVSNMIRNKDGKIWDYFQVHLTPCEKTNSISELETLFRFPIKIEKYRSPFKTQQCHNCQGYHHHADYCFMPPKCVKCAGDHRSSECTRPKNPTDDDPPKCVNCGKFGHTANWRGCESFPHNKIAKKAENNKQKTRMVDPNVRYSQILNPNSQNGTISRPPTQAQTTSPSNHNVSAHNSAISGTQSQTKPTTPTKANPNVQNTNNNSDNDTNVPILQGMASALADIQNLLGITDFLDLYNKILLIREQLINHPNPESRLFLFFNSVIALNQPSANNQSCP